MSFCFMDGILRYLDMVLQRYGSGQWDSGVSFARHYYGKGMVYMDLHRWNIRMLVAQLNRLRVKQSTRAGYYRHVQVQVQYRNEIEEQAMGQ
jgi:hypothetical protein